MVAQSRHQLLETGRDWATLWPTWIQSLEAVGILGGGDARYLLGMSRCFFLISWPKFRNTSIKSHKKSSHLHQISSNFSRSSVRWLIFFDWEVEWNIAKASSRWLPAVEPNLGWFIFHHCRWSIWPPSGSGDKQLLGQGLYLVWDQIWDPVPSSAIDVANLDLRYLEISWDGSCFRETFFFLRHLVHKSVALNMVKSHLLSGRWPPVVQTSHTSGVSWNGMNGAFQYICDGPWRLDENMMRTWWELDLCTYLRYSSVISTKVTLHYKWVYECIWFIWYDIMPMSYSPGLPPWRLRNLQMRSTRHRCHRNGLGNDVGAGWPSCQLWREKQSWVAMVLGSQQNDFKR